MYSCKQKKAEIEPFQLAGLLLTFIDRQIWNSILLTKLFWPTVRKNCSSDREKLLKFEAEGQEFAKFWDH